MRGCPLIVKKVLCSNTVWTIVSFL